MTSSCIRGITESIFITIWSRTTKKYRQTSYISRTFIGNETADPSDVVGASPDGAAPTTSSFSTYHLVSMDWAKTTARLGDKRLGYGIWCCLYYGFDGKGLQTSRQYCAMIVIQYSCCAVWSTGCYFFQWRCTVIAEFVVLWWFNQMHIVTDMFH